MVGIHHLSYSPSPHVERGGPGDGATNVSALGARKRICDLGMATGLGLWCPKMEKYRIWVIYG